jgi:hypothetical protein
MVVACQFGVDALDHAGQHLARAAFDHVVACRAP